MSDTNPASQGGDATIERIRAICARVDFDVDRLSPDVLDRMRRLSVGSETAADAMRMVDVAHGVFARYDATKPHARWSDVERRTVVLGSVFSDIGKTGPRDADIEQQQLVIDMFAVEGVRDETQSVEAFFRTYFPADAADRTARYRTLGLDPGMTIRAFWSRHAVWTLDILESGSFPPEAVAAAATHHYLDGINPDAMVASDGRFSRAFGENVAFDRAEQLVIVVDKYDAARRRGACTHERAMAWLRRWVAERAHFRDDPVLSELIDDVDLVMADAHFDCG